MEKNFKKDILRELTKSNGRILLHDEVEERPGVFSIIPIWEVVSEDEIMTPRDAFDLVIRQGYRVSVSRISYIKPCLTFLARLTMAVLRLYVCCMIIRS